MENPIIYNNGNIKLEHLSNIQFRSKLDNRILNGLVIGQEATQFIVRVNKTVTAKVDTHDILQVQVTHGDKNYFCPLIEYKLMQNKNQEIPLF